MCINGMTCGDGFRARQMDQTHDGDPPCGRSHCTPPRRAYRWFYHLNSHKHALAQFGMVCGMRNKNRLDADTPDVVRSYIISYTLYVVHQWRCHA